MLKSAILIYFSKKRYFSLFKLPSFLPNFKTMDLIYHKFYDNDYIQCFCPVFAL